MNQLTVHGLSNSADIFKRSAAKSLRPKIRRVKVLWSTLFSNPILSWGKRRREVLPAPTHERLLREALFIAFDFGTRTNQAILYLLREAEMHQVWLYPNSPHQTLKDWALTHFVPLRSEDTVRRLVNAVWHVVGYADRNPVISDDGEILLDGAALIGMAKPTALIKLAGTFASEDTDDADKQSLLIGLAEGTSDTRQILSDAGLDRVGKAKVRRRDVHDASGNYTGTVWHMRTTPEQNRVIERRLKDLMDEFFTADGYRHG